MLARLTLVWFVILILAVLNGGFRESVLLRWLGREPAQAVSTLMLSAIILSVSWTATPWIAPATLRDAWAIGAAWLVMTLAFEFFGGHFLFGKPWDLLFADYNVLAGRIWVLALLVTLMAPVVTFVQRGGDHIAG